MLATFLFLLLMHESSSSYPCLTRCMCKNIGTQAEWLKVSCQDHLQKVQDVDINSISYQTSQLDLSSNEIYTIENQTFRNLTNLQHLNLSKNEIIYLVEGSFSGLGKLEKLDLTQNRISSIETRTFKDLLNLKKIYLSGNRISELDVTIFYNLPSLSRLKLNGNNLATFKDGIFSGLKSLKQLDVSDNPWRCDCDLYWFSNWINNTTIKLNPPPKCTSPVTLRGQPIKRLRSMEDIQCDWTSPTIEIIPDQNQVAFVGDSLILKCRAPNVMRENNATLSWFWRPNATEESALFQHPVNPPNVLSNVKIEDRSLSESGILDSSLSIASVEEEHNGQWKCLLLSKHGNQSRSISVFVISNETQFCPLAVTRNNKGVYAWPRTMSGWKAELACEGSGLSGLMQAPLRATYSCDENSRWADLDTETCPYISPTTKILEQFSKINLTLTKGNLLEMAKKFRNYTSDKALLTDPVEINFITETIENYVPFLALEKDVAHMLLDVVNGIQDLPKRMLRTAEFYYKSCSKLVNAIEKISGYAASEKSHKSNMALEEFRVRPGSFTGLTCTWYSSTEPGDAKQLYCATNNKTATLNAKRKSIIASIQLPASLFKYVDADGDGGEEEAAAHHLIISVYNDNKLFPIMSEENEGRIDILSSVIGSKLIGTSIENMADPVYVMLKAPLHHHAVSKPKPVFWDPMLNGTGGWTTEGCHFINLLSDLIIFRCDKLGYYGLSQDISFLSDTSKSFIGAKFKLSNPGVYAGSFILITCLVMSTLTYACGYSAIVMPKKQKHSLVNTWLAIISLCTFYTIGIHQTESMEICQAIGIAVHYLSLCCLLWMIVCASNMQKGLTNCTEHEDVSDDEPQELAIEKPLLGLYLVGWGIALIICGISGTVHLREYAGYSYCFLSSTPAIAALFVPAILLLFYLTILQMLIRCAIRNNPDNGQMSEGSNQATENLDLELLETGAVNPPRNGRESSSSTERMRSAPSEVEDTEHTRLMQLRAQVIVEILFLVTWCSAALIVVDVFHVPYNEIIFSGIYALSASFLGMFILFFYGIARTDVRSQWGRMRCWLKKRKNKCCRARSVSDANPVVSNQPLVIQHNLTCAVPTLQGTQMTSDTNSLSSSRHTNKFYISNCNIPKQDNSATDSSSKTKKSMPNPNIVTIHRQQYRSNNSMSTFNTENSAPVCVEMFYNPHQSGVARKFFKRQRRYTKNNLGSRRPGDGGATSDGGSCVSVPRRAVKLATDIEKQVFGTSSAKVNNTNIHVESCERISDAKNQKMIPEIPEMQHPLNEKQHGIKKVNNCFQKQRNAINECQSTCGSCCDLHSKSTNDENPQQLRNVSQQCTLDCSSDLELMTQTMSENSDMSDMMMRFKVKSGVNEKERLLGRYAYSSGNLATLQVGGQKEHARVLTSRSCNSSLNDVYSLSKSSKNCEYSRSSRTDDFVPSTSSLNFMDKATCSNKEDSSDTLDWFQHLLEDEGCGVARPNAGESCGASMRITGNHISENGREGGYDSEEEKRETSV